MFSFKKEIGRIYRLKVPFEDLYTSVFLIKDTIGNLLIDCATTARDVDEIIIPALYQIGLSLNDLEQVLLTHKHSDHVGGLERLLQLKPNLQIVNKMDIIRVDDISVYPLKGHTLDSIGCLDLQSGTLISGDGFQGAGVGTYRCFLECKEEYLKTIEKVKFDEKVKNILFSHAYEPWCRDKALGVEEKLKCLQACIEYINKEIKK
jgi:glyoxylase-like metal-dependent hydrolase (beta-lactamase superfamily II)